MATSKGKLLGMRIKEKLKRKQKKLKWIHVTVKISLKILKIWRLEVMKLVKMIPVTQQ